MDICLYIKYKSQQSEGKPYLNSSTPSTNIAVGRGEGEGEGEGEGDRDTYRLPIERWRERKDRYDPHVYHLIGGVKNIIGNADSVWSASEDFTIIQRTANVSLSLVSSPDLPPSSPLPRFPPCQNHFHPCHADGHICEEAIRTHVVGALYGH